MKNHTISFSVNGRQITVEADEKQTLLRLLRDELGLMGTKNGCSNGHCGACTVLVDGKAKRSCLLRTKKLDGAKILTIEGLAQNGELHPLQQAFAENGAIQCGFCTPGMVLAAVALLQEKPHPSDEEILVGMNGHICRCNGYVKIVRAVHAAADRMERAGR